MNCNYGDTPKELIHARMSAGDRGYVSVCKFIACELKVCSEYLMPNSSIPSCSNSEGAIDLQSLFLRCLSKASQQY